jgi:hypothetical protein
MNKAIEEWAHKRRTAIEGVAKCLRKSVAEVLDLALECLVYSPLIESLLGEDEAIDMKSIMGTVDRCTPFNISSSQTLSIVSFLDEIYDLSQAGDTETATDKIFDTIDRLLINECFTIVDVILHDVDVDRIDTGLMRSFLTITCPAKGKLPSRESLYKKIEAKMIYLKGQEGADRIIGLLK